MPFYLDNFHGGLGNQLFSILTIYTLAKKYNTTFSVNDTILQMNGFDNRFILPIYLDTVFRELLKASKKIDTTQYTATFDIQMHQFIECNIPTDIDPTSTLIIIKGLPMKYSLFNEYLEDIKDILYKEKERYSVCLLKNPIVRKVGIMFRTFTSENKKEWMTNHTYYTNAIQYLLAQYTCNYTFEFHIFTDNAGVSENIIKPIINTLNITVELKEYVGIRDNKTDVEHFFRMFDLDDYILCNSTYHYWPALLSRYTDDKIVTYPGDTGSGWFDNIVSPDWVKL